MNPGGCGTIGGYRAHLKRDEETCTICRKANVRYAKLHKARKFQNLPTTSLVSSVGTLRRVQALMCLGWPVTVITEKAGVTRRDVAYLENHPRIDKTYAGKIAAVYERLCMTLPEAKDVNAQTQALVRNIAKKRRYLPPLAWDDIDNDERGYRAYD